MVQKGNGEDRSGDEVGKVTKQEKEKEKDQMQDGEAEEEEEQTKGWRKDKIGKIYKIGG